jgi:hypothetical protein
MRRLAIAIIVLFIGSVPAFAHHRHYVRRAPNVAIGLGYGLEHMLGSIGPRPSRWCGWEMRREMGVSDPAYNLARNWSHYGSPAAGPAIGVIVVWPHHVGRLVGGGPGAWIVHSGNDGHVIRDRQRSLKGVIAYRWP